MFKPLSGTMVEARRVDCQGSLPQIRLLQATWAQSLRSALGVSACEGNESVFEILT